MQLNLMPQIQAVNPYHEALQTGLQNYMNTVKAAYLPLSEKARIASQMTYSNLMGPQFLAKLMGNSDVVANLSPEQRNNALNTTYNAATGQAVANSILNNQQPTFFDKLKNFFSPEQQNQASPPNNLTPSQQVNAAYPDQVKAMHDEYARTGQGQFVIPQPSNQQPQPNNQSYFEKAGEAAGLKKEGEELGSQRVKSIGELNDEYKQALSANAPIKHLIAIAKNPLFQGLRKYPAFQQLQLDTKATFGNPDEQRIIGDFQTTAQTSVAQGLGGMKGRILDKEVTMFNKMKPSGSDNINVIMGKLPTIDMFNEMTMQRSRLASQLIRTNHITKDEALEQADKMVNGEAIRQKVQNDLDRSQMISVRNKKTGETRRMSLIEARKLGVPNV